MTDDAAVECAEHGSRAGAIVCRHLPGGQGAGFNQVCAPEEPDCLFPDAWCDACEAVLDREGEWNERAQAFADLRLLCSECYMRARLLNWPRETIQETMQLIQRSVDYLQSRQELLRREQSLSGQDSRLGHAGIFMGAGGALGGLGGLGADASRGFRRAEMVYLAAARPAPGR